MLVDARRHRSRNRPGSRPSQVAAPARTTDGPATSPDPHEFLQHLPNGQRALSPSMRRALDRRDAYPARDPWRRAGSAASAFVIRCSGFPPGVTDLVREFVSKEPPVRQPARGAPSRPSPGQAAPLTVLSRQKFLALAADETAGPCRNRTLPPGSVARRPCRIGLAEQRQPHLVLDELHHEPVIAGSRSPESVVTVKSGGSMRRCRLHLGEHAVHSVSVFLDQAHRLEHVA